MSTKHNKVFDKTVVIGRFNPCVHIGHVDAIRQALSISDRVFLVISDKDHMTSKRSPISLVDRIDSIKKTVADFFKGCRVYVVAVDGSCCDTDAMKALIRQSIGYKKGEIVARVCIDSDTSSSPMEHNYHIKPTQVSFRSQLVNVTNEIIMENWMNGGMKHLRNMSILPVSSEIFLHEFSTNNPCHYKKLNHCKVDSCEMLNSQFSYVYIVKNHDRVLVCGDNNSGYHFPMGVEPTGLNLNLLISCSEIISNTVTKNIRYCISMNAKNIPSCLPGAWIDIKELAASRACIIDEHYDILRKINLIC